MAIDFPSSPTDGQVFGQYVYDGSLGVWRRGVNTDVSDLENRIAELETDLSSLQQQLAWAGASRPAFQAYGSSTTSASGTQAWRKLNFINEHFDQGGYYNSSLSRFIAPVPGVYQFSFSVVQTTSVGGPEIAVFKNGSLAYDLAAIGYGQNYHTFSNTVIMQLVSSDYVEIHWRNNNSTSVTLDQGRSYFSGYFVG